MKTPNKVLVTPTCIKTGNTAPSIVIEVNKNQKNWEDRAIQQAKEQSRLGDFDNWGFVVK